MNQVSLVGRIVRTPELKETESKKKMAYLTIAVSRTFKNVNGEYETDFIDCVMWDAVAVSATSYCKRGDIVAVRGRIQIDNYEKDGVKKHTTQIICERINFICSSTSNEIEEKNTKKQEKSM